MIKDNKWILNEKTSWFKSSMLLIQTVYIFFYVTINEYIAPGTVYILFTFKQVWPHEGTAMAPIC